MLQLSFYCVFKTDMTPQRQLNLANIWTIIGLLPFTLMLCWCAALFATTVPGQLPVIPTLDPFGMIGLSLMSFLFMLIVAGPQLWWAWQLTSHYDTLRTTTAMTLRIAGVTLILTPLWLSLYFSASRH